VSCVSSSSCVAVGFSATSSVTDVLVMVWDGSTWSVLPNPAAGETGEQLLAATCVSESWCVGVGSTSGSSETSVLALTGPEPEPEPGPTTTTTTTPTDQVIPVYAG
jgi:hypothetical protein